MELISLEEHKATKMSKFKGFAATNCSEIAWIWRRTMYGWIDLIDDFVGFFPTDENEDAFVSTFGCCFTSACAPKKPRRTAFKHEMT